MSGPLYWTPMCEVPGSRPLVAKSLEVIRVDDSESCVVSGDGSSKSEEYLLMNGKVDFSYKNKQQVVRILILKPNNEKKMKMDNEFEWKSKTKVKITRKLALQRKRNINCMGRKTDLFRLNDILYFYIQNVHCKHEIENNSKRNKILKLDI